MRVVSGALQKRPRDRRSHRGRYDSSLPKAPPCGGHWLTDQGQPLPPHERVAAAVVRDDRDPVLFAFDPRREAIFLVAGDKAGNWDGWYREAIPLADERFTQHLTELVAEESRKQ